MTKPHGILIFGANGSGKTTLGRELAHILNFKHIDHEDYAFEKSVIPYTVAIPREKCTELMLEDIKKSYGFILSAVTGDFGKEMELLYDLAVYMEAPIDVRVKRVERRGYEQHGERVLEGGDMYEQHKRFVEFVAAHPLSGVEEYANTLNCPIIRANGTADYRRTAAYIVDYYQPRKKRI